VNKNILLVGTVSNVSKTIRKELWILLKALSYFDSIEVYLVESDSTDSTVNLLEKIKSIHVNFDFISMSSLKSIYPDRITRIAYCRKIYVDYIRTNYRLKKWDYIAVADLDGMNMNLTRKGIETCFTQNLHWDAIMANQTFGYYDIFALRSNGWVEGDCFQEMHAAKQNSNPPKQLRNSALNFISLFMYHDKFRKDFIYNQMKILPRRKFITVESAFGGFAIYRSKIFLKYNYTLENNSASEHVAFHKDALKSNAKFYINTSLINNHINIYNLNKLTLIRMTRAIKTYFRNRHKT
jgi:hypothetical protein